MKNSVLIGLLVVLVSTQGHAQLFKRKECLPQDYQVQIRGTFKTTFPQYIVDKIKDDLTDQGCDPSKIQSESLNGGCNLTRPDLTQAVLNQGNWKIGKITYEKGELTVSNISVSVGTDESLDLRSVNLDGINQEGQETEHTSYHVSKKSEIVFEFQKNHRDASHAPVCIFEFTLRESDTDKRDEHPDDGFAVIDNQEILYHTNGQPGQPLKENEPVSSVTHENFESGPLFLVIPNKLHR